MRCSAEISDPLAWERERKKTEQLENEWNDSSFPLNNRPMLNSVLSGQLAPSNLTAYIVNEHTLSVTWDLPSNVNAIEKIFITVTELGRSSRTIQTQSFDNSIKKLDIQINANDPFSMNQRSLSLSFSVARAFSLGIHPNRTVHFAARAADRNGQNSSTIEYQLYVNMHSKSSWLRLVCFVLCRVSFFETKQRFPRKGWKTSACPAVNSVDRTAMSTLSLLMHAHTLRWVATIIIFDLCYTEKRDDRLTWKEEDEGHSKRSRLCRSIPDLIRWTSSREVPLLLCLFSQKSDHAHG